MRAPRPPLCIGCAHYRHDSGPREPSSSRLRCEHPQLREPGTQRDCSTSWARSKPLDGEPRCGPEGSLYEPAPTQGRAWTHLAGAAIAAGLFGAWALWIS